MTEGGRRVEPRQPRDGSWVPLALAAGLVSLLLLVLVLLNVAA